MRLSRSAFLQALMISGVTWRGPAVLFMETLAQQESELRSLQSQRLNFELLLEMNQSAPAPISAKKQISWKIHFNEL